MRHSILIHTTDPELYLILRYILEQAGHDVDLLPSLDMFLPDEANSQPHRRTVLICLAMDDLLRSAVLIKKEQPDIRVVGFPLDNKKMGGVQSSVFDYLVRRPLTRATCLSFSSLACVATQPHQLMSAFFSMTWKSMLHPSGSGGVRRTSVFRPCISGSCCIWQETQTGSSAGTNSSGIAGPRMPMSNRVQWTFTSAK